MFQFNPAITHIDYSQPLRKALLTEDIFKKKAYYSALFFFILFKMLLKNEIIWNY